MVFYYQHHHSFAILQSGRGENDNPWFNYWELPIFCVWVMFVRYLPIILSLTPFRILKQNSWTSNFCFASVKQPSHFGFYFTAACFLFSLLAFFSSCSHCQVIQIHFFLQSKSPFSPSSKASCGSCTKASYTEMQAWSRTQPRQSLFTRINPAFYWGYYLDTQWSSSSRITIVMETPACFSTCSGYLILFPSFWRCMLEKQFLSFLEFRVWKSHTMCNQCFPSLVITSLSLPSLPAAYNYRQ